MTLVPDMPMQDYRREPAISASSLKLIERSPAHYRHSAHTEPSRAMHVGTAIHTAILEPERFNAEYISLSVDDRRKSEYKEAAAHYGSEYVLTATEAAHVNAAAESVHANPAAARLLGEPGHRELSVFATDPETGVACKCRPDVMTDGGVMLDLKKTRDARNLPMQRAIANYGYDLSAAYYCDVYEWATSEAPSAYALLCVEDEPPYGVRVLVLDDTWLARGRQRYRKALDTYAACVQSDEWPGYDSEPTVIAAPKWVEYEMEGE